MSLNIIKAGICDTFQDLGRKGLQYLGINPGGAMDRLAMQMANVLVGNDAREAVLEMHFPAACILFEQPGLIVIGGADFAPEIDGESISIWQPVYVPAGSILRFRKRRSGSWCYLALHGGFKLEPWLNGSGTHLKLAAGGWKGRALRKGDRIMFRLARAMPFLFSEETVKLWPWHAVPPNDPAPANEIWVVAGPEQAHLNEQSKAFFEEEPFAILPASDRMAYSLKGPVLKMEKKEQLVSAAVGFGTIQLLPDGQLMILMADHQTTGGYPRIGQVIYAHLSRLAQCRPGDKIKFKTISGQQAQQLWLLQYQHLTILEYACRLKMESLKLL